MRLIITTQYVENEHPKGGGEVEITNVPEDMLPELGDKIVEVAKNHIEWDDGNKYEYVLGWSVYAEQERTDSEALAEVCGDDVLTKSIDFADLGIE